MHQLRQRETCLCNHQKVSQNELVLPVWPEPFLCLQFLLCLEPPLRPEVNTIFILMPDKNQQYIRRNSIVSMKQVQDIQK